MTEILRTTGLTKRFRALVANDSIDFRLDAASIRCVIGPNGAGKTTFVSMISGHLPPSAGEIRFKGEVITDLPIAHRARMGIARKFQTPSVFERLSVRENLELAALGKRGSRGHRQQRVRETLEMIRLTHQRDDPASSLSHGQRQWLEVGMLLANEAELLLLDEPTAGMTAEETHATSELVRRLATNFNLAVVIIEHDINFIRDLRAPVTVLHLGRVLTEGSFDEVAENEDVRNVYLGHA